MSIADKIYLKVQQLPEDVAREVLDYIDYLEIKYGLAGAQAPARDQVSRPLWRCIQENPDDVVWSDLLFGRSSQDEQA